MMPGFCVIARRAGVPLVPVALDGAFDSWPRQRWLPRPATIHVVWGPPILPDEVARFSDDELVAEVLKRVRACHRIARQGRLRAMRRR
jgi:1-acyl-sn-glycerol-3-phosphate acyltransferase